MAEILRLTLSELPFRTMVSEEKRSEYRDPSPWILSRLHGRRYSRVRFTWGYGSNRPWFETTYLGWGYIDNLRQEKYTTGLAVNLLPGTIEIKLGRFLDSGNLELLRG